jgi:diguanylate cyclase (GGDEF)-like protein
MRLRLVRPEDARRQWLLVFPNPLLDRVTVWQRSERGGWQSQSAGDRQAVDSWPEPGRYPVFRLELPPGQARDVYLELRSAVPTSVPMRLTSDVAHSQRQQLETLGLGLTFGALALLIATCLAQSWIYEDRVYGWYALYAFLATACAFAFTGLAAQWVWPGAAAWADTAPGEFALLAAGAAVLFVRTLTGLAARHPRLGLSARLFGWSAVPVALLFLAIPRRSGLELMVGYVSAAAALAFVIAWRTWRRRDVVGLWVLAAYLPLGAGVAVAVVRLLGVVPLSFATQYLSLMAMVVQVPLLLVALTIRSRDRHGARLREQTLSSQDALTGLLAPHLFQDRLRQAVQRYERDREDAAVVFIDLVNYPWIKARHGGAVAEQSLLRSVIKLRRVVRDIDSVGRVGEARFGLILEGAAARAAVTDRAARLIAAGLMPLPGLKPDVTLQFHVAAVLLRERLLPPAELADNLAELLATMSPRTRRPIRFLKPEDTVPAPLEGDSEPPAAALLAGRPAALDRAQ